MAFDEEGNLVALPPMLKKKPARWGTGGRDFLFFPHGELILGEEVNICKHRVGILLIKFHISS